MPRRAGLTMLAMALRGLRVADSRTPAAAATPQCGAGQYCASGGVCWPDAVAPVIDVGHGGLPDARACATRRWR